MDRLSVDAQYNTYASFYGFFDPAEVLEDIINGNSYQSERLNSYDLFDFGLTYKFNLGSNDIVFRGNVYNAFNKNYVNQKDGYGYYLGNGRTWNASLRYNF